MEDVCVDFTDDLRTFANFLELFSFMICLPVYIYVDIFELMNSLWVQWDEQMRTSIVRNASLLTDLALVRVVLSDKTGTITSGKKTVQQFAILGSLGWDVLDTQTLVEELRDQSRQVQANRLALLVSIEVAAWYSWYSCRSLTRFFTSSTAWRHATLSR